MRRRLRSLVTLSPYALLLLPACLCCICLALPAQAAETPGLFYRRLPPFIPEGISSACLVSYGTDRHAVVCALRDGSLLGMIYLSSDDNFLINTFHECDDPVLDLTVFDMQVRGKATKCFAGIGARTLHLFSGDFALLLEKEFEGAEAPAFFLQGDAGGRGPESRLYFCRGSAVYSLALPGLKEERIATLPAPACAARLCVTADGERLAVGVTEGGDLWTVDVERGSAHVEPSGLRPVTGLDRSDLNGEREGFPVCVFRDGHGGARLAVAHLGDAGGSAAAAVTCFAISRDGMEELWTVDFPEGPCISLAAGDSALYAGGGTIWRGEGTGGWIRRYGLDGEMERELRVPCPVGYIRRVGETICALDRISDGGRHDSWCLTVASPSLRRLWMESCVLNPKGILAGDIGGDSRKDIVVVGDVLRFVGERGVQGERGEVDCYINRMGVLERMAQTHEESADDLSAEGQIREAEDALSLARSIRWSLADEDAAGRIGDKLEEMRLAEARMERLETVTLVVLAVFLVPVVWKRKTISALAERIAAGLFPGSRKEKALREPPSVSLVQSVLEFQHSGSISKALTRLGFNLANTNPRTERGREAAATAAGLAQSFEANFRRQIEDIASIINEVTRDAPGHGESLQRSLEDRFSDLKEEIPVFVDAVSAGEGLTEAASRLDNACERLKSAVLDVARAVNRSFFCSVGDALSMVLANEERSLAEAGVIARVHDTRSRELGVVIRPHHLIFVLQNLVENAIRAMSQSEEKVLSVTVRVEGVDTVVEVSDTGAGVPQALRGVIFDAGGSRAPSADSRGKGGFGLNHSRKLLQEYGGSVRLLGTSSSKGSTFAVGLRTWPRGAPIPRDEERSSGEGPARGRPM